jgi:hypothetical protein
MLKDKNEEKKSIEKDLKKWHKLTCQTCNLGYKIEITHGKQIKTNYKFQSLINPILKDG